MSGPVSLPTRTGAGTNMAELAHPYSTSNKGLLQAVAHLRKSFPGTVTAETLKKLNIAPNNESYVINVLRFLGVLDDQGKKVPEAGKIFSAHEDGAFAKGFGSLVESSYKELFELHGQGAWTLAEDDLIAF